MDWKEQEFWKHLSLGPPLLPVKPRCILPLTSMTTDLDQLWVFLKIPFFSLHISLFPPELKIFFLSLFVYLILLLISFLKIIPKWITTPDHVEGWKGPVETWWHWEMSPATLGFEFRQAMGKAMPGFLSVNMEGCWGIWAFRIPYSRAAQSWGLALGEPYDFQAPCWRSLQRFDSNPGSALSAVAEPRGPLNSCESQGSPCSQISYHEVGSLRALGDWCEPEFSKSFFYW